MVMVVQRRSGRSSGSFDGSHGGYGQRPRQERPRRSGGAGSRNGRQSGGRRPISKRQRAIYRRRRIVVGIALLLVLALILFCVYSLWQGFSAVARTVNHANVYALDRTSVPEPKATSGVGQCDESNVHLELSAKATTIPVGGSAQFTATIVHDGTGSCLIDDSTSSLVMTVTSGNDVVYRSDVCEADPHELLMAQGDKRADERTWNANRTGAKCVADAQLSKVDRGSYAVTIALKDHPKVVSDPVTISVQ